MFLLFCHFRGIPLIRDTDLAGADQPFSLYLLSIGSGLRMQMHNTWLFLAAFGTLGVASILWVAAEKWQQGSKWNRRDALWMLGFISLLGGSAILYGLGTNGALARKFARSGTFADVLGIGLIIAVPIILWLRWRRRDLKSSQDDDEGLISSPDFPRSVLGLQDTSAEANHHVAKTKRFHIADTFAVVKPPVSQPAEWLEGTFREQSALTKKLTRNEAVIMEDRDFLNIGAQSLISQERAGQPLTAQPFADQLPVERTFTSQMAALPTRTQDKEMLPPATFREQLFALNASWQRIEETGKEVEDWFQHQQKRVLAHLERHPGKDRERQIELSRDFLDRRMEKVDAEWAAIHRTIREINRWLENSNSGKEAVEETQVG